MITTLMKQPNAQMFHQPVDIILYGIPDYPNIVKKPMDFGTIKAKLLSNIYNSSREFLDDIELVFYNCVLYNGVSESFNYRNILMWEELLCK
jgi:bromodomain-containing factor 1